MFTGIIEEIGIITDLSFHDQGLSATIRANKVLQGIKLGDSIAVNGVCVTVTNFTSRNFTVDVMAETINKTLWCYAELGNKVHLEAALTLAKPLGGHIVTGHVNGIGTVINIIEEKLHTILVIKPPPALLRYIVPQGSIAINGASLTICDVTNENFSVSLIPHTIANTNLLDSPLVNLEVDILAKYLEKLMLPTRETKTGEESTLTLKDLLQAGF